MKNPFMILTVIFWVTALLLVIRHAIRSDGSSSKSSSRYRRITEEERSYAKASHKQGIRGVNAKTISTAKDALSQMEYGYSQIKSQVSAASASIYQEDINDVRSNVEGLVLDKWQTKAELILDEFISLYLLITDEVSFSDVDKAHASKGRCLAKYDAYWAWTAKIHEENKDCFHSLNLWNEARELFKQHFEDAAPLADHCMLVWGQSTNLSTRERIDKRLTDCIRTMQPEYKRKMKLRSMILKDINQKNTVQRSEFLKTKYDGFIDKEILACYKGLVREGFILEVKQGSRYFSSLTDKGQKKIAGKPKQKPSASASAQPETACDYTSSAFVEELTKREMEYTIRQTARGQSVWIRFNPAQETFIANSTVNGETIAKAQTTQFFEQGEWFVRI